MNDGQRRQPRAGGWRVGALSLFLALGVAACGNPEACPEPCPENMYCNYGACVPYHDATAEDRTEDAGE